MYGVETRRLKEQVKRNKERFPSDFMFQLAKGEWTELIAICDKLPENIKYSPITPLAFTQEGVSMLSSVLRSKIAIEINISIMRAFVLMRKMITGYEDLRQRIEQLEVETNMQFNDIYLALTELASKKEAEEKPHKPVGYIIPKND